tara:strand:- start:480 stop:1103 length:624 start_codon:yes stop_codon:yes gene_type:complete
MILIILVVILAIILVTVYEVFISKISNSLKVKSVNNYYISPTKKKDTIKLKKQDKNNVCSYSFFIRTDLKTFENKKDWIVFYRGDKDKQNLKVIVSEKGNLTVIVNGSSMTVKNIIKLRKWTHIGICLNNINKFAELYINGDLYKTTSMNNIKIGDKPLVINPENKDAYIQNLNYYLSMLSSKQMKKLYEKLPLMVIINRYLFDYKQ